MILAPPFCARSLADTEPPTIFDKVGGGAGIKGRQLPQGSGCAGAK